MPTKEQTIEILRQAIPGMRKGLQTPVYLHSVAVGEILERHGFSEEIVNAGYLHDIIEDGGYTFAQLKELGYTDHTIHLVDLVSHNNQDHQEDKYKAWSGMIGRMIKEENTDAWAVKISDLIHNLSECHNCTLSLMQSYLFFKAPVFIYYGNKYFAAHSLYKEFLETYWLQVQRYHKYFI